MSFLAHSGFSPSLDLAAQVQFKDNSNVKEIRYKSIVSLKKTFTNVNNGKKNINVKHRYRKR